MIKTKTICEAEFFILVISVFAFSYFLSFSSGDFEKSESLDFSFFKSLWNEIKKPMFKIVSAESGVGCCSLNNGVKCVTSTEENCQGDFAEGALCSSTSFCKKGCCYDEVAGIFDVNVLRSDCTKEWGEDYNCNLPGAKNGCCVLGDVAIFETAGQCNTDTNVRAIGGKGQVDFRDVNEMECLMLSGTEKEGACVVGKSCRFVTEKDCLGYNGKFYEGYLCTSSEIGSLCEKTTQTTCVDGKDGVYFLDSCGNYANIYDASKINDQSYWDKVVLLDNSCDGKLGSSKSATCGNCNRFLGGICSSSSYNFKVNFGNFYCKPTSCNYKGEEYKNGESWCVYDGAIGNGDDVVGSRHWKYVCNYGEVQIEPCADYRNQICIQTNTFDVDGQSVEFRNAVCIANNWRECISLNSEEDGMEKCASALNCEVRKIDIADHFNFDVCTPKYPGGFNLNDVRYAETAKQVCGMASQKCTVVYKPKTMGGCSLEANGDCLKEEFGQKMNDWCRSLGDCGGEVNIVGQYSENYKITKSPKLSSAWISKLKSLASPVSGQFAEVENYTEYLEAAGIMSASTNGEPYDPSKDIMMVGAGVAGIAIAGYMAGIGVFTTTTLLAESLETGEFILSTSMSGFAGVAIGAGIGMVAGMYLAKTMGLSPMGSILMSVGGAMIGAVIGYNIIMEVAMCASGIGCAIVIAGLVIMIIGAFFGGSDCDPVVVEFECKPWEPPKGGSDCEKCNNDANKPCSEYRCQSLGAACELINKGTGSEMCVEKNPNDVTPPKISPEYGTISDGIVYGENKNGFSITSNGGCVDAYTDLVFGVDTDEPAQCKFDLTMTNFSDMQFDMGGNIFSNNHTTGMTLPDPSHGESKGGNWSGDVNLYIKCQDTHGIETPSYYVINMCVNQGVDKTAPRVRTTEPQNNMLVSFNSTEKSVKIITNELSECKWSSNDGDYLTMENSFVCSDTLQNPSSVFGYSCSGNLPITNSENKFYIKCMDQPWLNGSGNSNSESFVYILRKPEKPISIDEIFPNTGFESSTDYTTINLQVTTSGGGSDHICAYSFSGYDKMIDFFERDVNIHKQPLNVKSATNHIYIQCRDETGDYVRGETEFTIIYDDSSPVISRVWRTDDKINYVTSEEAICVYSEDSCSVDFGTSTELSAEHSIDVLDGKVYFIKCKDEFGNAPAGCSITVNAAGKVA